MGHGKEDIKLLLMIMKKNNQITFICEKDRSHFAKSILKQLNHKPLLVIVVKNLGNHIEPH